MRTRNGSTTPGGPCALTMHPLGELRALKDGGEKDSERAKETGAFWYGGTARQRISSIEAPAPGSVPPQAPKRGTRSVYASRRRLRRSVPIVRDERTPKGQRRRCAACGAVRAYDARRGITLTRRVAASIHRLPRRGLLGNYPYAERL